MNGLWAFGMVLTLLAGSWLAWQLLRQNGRMLLRLEALEERLNKVDFGESAEPDSLPLGSPAPEISLPNLAAQTRTLAEYRGQSVLLLFFNPNCGFCREMLPKLKEQPESREQKAAIKSGSEELGNGGPPERPSVLIITTGDGEANRTLFDEHKVSCPVLLQKGSEVAEVYRANGTPSGYLINAEGKIASDLAMGGEALVRLLAGNKESVEPSEVAVGNASGTQTPLANNGDRRAKRFRNRSLPHSKIKRDGLKTGTPAPDFRLPRLHGRGELSLSELRGRRVLLVFSSPGCGPCDMLAPQLEKFHRTHPELEVVMISKGEPRENRAKVKEHGLTFPIVLQQQWEISRRYAMFATPIAYLIDEQGVISHEVAVGTDAILALIAPMQQDAERDASISSSELVSA